MNKVTMIDYINEQSIVCQNIIQNRKQILTDFNDNINLAKTQWIFLATGSSLNAINSVKYFIEQICDVEINIYDPSVFVHYMEHWNKDVMFFVISQSGKSTSTLNAIKKLQSNNISDVFLLTSNHTIQESLKKIIINCGEEKIGFVTKGFTSTVTTLILMALEYAYKTQKISKEQYDLEIEKLIDHSSLIDDVIKRSFTWYEQNKHGLIQANRYIILAYGDQLGIANEATTKLIETVRYPTSSYELEEYMHGPYLELSSNHCIFFIESSGVLLERAKLLKKYVQTQGATCYSISTETRERNFTLAKEGFDFPICSVILFQVIAALLSKDKGVDIQIPIFSDFDEVLKSKI